MLTREDRHAIDGLFERLNEVDQRSGPRDAEADSYIRSKIAAQPAATYYLAQTVVVQREALKEAERRIEALEREGRQIDQRRGPWDRDSTLDNRRRPATLHEGGFLAGAAQTALGVAGGIMLGSLIGSIFTSGAANADEFADAPENDGAAESNDAGTDDGGGLDDGGFDGGGFDMGGDF